MNEGERKLRDFDQLEAQQVTVLFSLIYPERGSTETYYEKWYRVS